MKLHEIISQQVDFNNWVMPSVDDLSREYKVEYILKDLPDVINIDPFPTEKSFIEAVNSSKTEKITRDMDKSISYRSRINNKNDLLSLIKSYRSYPQYRNEKTLDEIFNGFNDNKPMVRPIILDINGRKRIFSGNTRMDVAYMLGIEPECVVVKISETAS